MNSSYKLVTVTTFCKFLYVDLLLQHIYSNKFYMFVGIYFHTELLRKAFVPFIADGKPEYADIDCTLYLIITS